MRLAEDYAFRAAGSAYEERRREAERVDPSLEARLSGTALDRLQEQPLRLVETARHASPWHKTLASDAVREAIGAILLSSRQGRGLRQEDAGVRREAQTAADEHGKAAQFVADTVSAVPL